MAIFMTAIADNQCYDGGCRGAGGGACRMVLLWRASMPLLSWFILVGFRHRSVIGIGDVLAVENVTSKNAHGRSGHHRGCMWRALNLAA